MFGRASVCRAGLRASVGPGHVFRPKDSTALKGPAHRVRPCPRPAPAAGTRGGARPLRNQRHREGVAVATSARSTLAASGSHASKWPGRSGLGASTQPACGNRRARCRTRATPPGARGASRNGAYRYLPHGASTATALKRAEVCPCTGASRSDRMARRPRQGRSAWAHDSEEQGATRGSASTWS